MNFLADRFEAFIEFLEELRLNGYNISTQQYLAVQNLLIALAANGQFPDDPKKLSTVLAPIVCSSAEEQEGFYYHYKQWVERLEKQEYGDRQEELQPGETADVSVKGKERQSLFQRFKPYAVILIASPVLAAIIVALFYFFILPPPININANNAPNNDNTENEQVNSNTDNTNAGNGNIAINTNISGITNTNRAKDPAAVPVILTSDVSVFAPEEEATRSLWTRLHPYLRAGAAALPFLLLGAWWLWQRIQQWRLKRWFSKVVPFLEDIKVKGLAEHLFRQSELRRAAQQLRRHREVGVLDLAVQQSVEVTARKAGWFTPVYSPRKAIPEYLVLIDRIGFSDQMARLEDELINRLIENDINVSRYYFEGDPRLCRKGAGTPYLKLQDLEAKHPNDFLLVFSDGAGLINPLTGRMQRWVELFLPWTGRALMTTEPAVNWGYRERVLTEQGFALLPASSEGISVLVRTIQTGNIPRAERDGSPHLYPEILGDRPERWFADREPDVEEIEVLRIELQYFLGMGGYYWLCACAVYPALQWELTLYFGYKLTGLEGLEEGMMNLVRLPWFRQGSMPDWLRARLIAALPEEEKEVTRQAVQELLLSALDNPDGFSLTVARKPADRKAPGLAGLLRGVAARVRTFYKKLQFRALIRKEPPDSPLRDYVFLSFLAGNKPDPLSVGVPKLLRRIFFKRGQPVLGLRPASALALAGIVAVLTWGLFPKLPAPPAAAPLPQFKVSPSSGVQGGRVLLSVTNSAGGGDCVKHSLNGAVIVEPAGSGLVVGGVSSHDCELMTGILIDRDAPLGPVELAIKRGEKIIGTFPFLIEPDNVVADYEAKPSAGTPGGNLTIVISNRDPAFDCARRSLMGVDLIAPATSGITVNSISTDDCTLTAQVAIANSAPAGKVLLTLRKNVADFGSIEFTVSASPPPDNVRLIISPASLLINSTTLINIRSSDCSAYNFTDAKLNILSAGVLITDVAVVDRGCGLTTEVVLNSDYVQSPVTFTLSKGGRTRTFTIPIRHPDCPTIDIAGPDSIVEGESLTLSASISGGPALQRPKYRWTWFYTKSPTIISDTFQQETDTPQITITAKSPDPSRFPDLIMALEVIGYNPACNEQFTPRLLVKILRNQVGTLQLTFRPKGQIPDDLRVDIGLMPEGGGSPRTERGVIPLKTAAIAGLPYGSYRMTITPNSGRISRFIQIANQQGPPPSLVRNIVINQPLVTETIAFDYSDGEIRLPDPGVESVRLEIKTRQMGISTGAMLVEVTVRTLGPDGEVPKLEIYYMELLDGRQGRPQRFDRQSSPAIQVLPAGRYYFWATRPGSTTPVSDRIIVDVK
jgi:hypothetical protein